MTLTSNMILHDVLIPSTFISNRFQKKRGGKKEIYFWKKEGRTNKNSFLNKEKEKAKIKEERKKERKTKKDFKQQYPKIDKSEKREKKKLKTI